MELGISTASYYNKCTTEDAVTDIAMHGVGLCEVFLNSFCEYEWDYAQQLSERIRACGIRVYSVHPMSTQFEPQLFSIHPRQLADARAFFKKVLESARLFGATHYVLHGPPHLSGAAKNIQLERVAPLLLEYTAMAREYGVTLTLENVSWCVFSSPEYGVRLRERVGAGALSFTLDIKQALRSGHDPLAYAAAIGTDLENVHLCGVRFLPDGGFTLAMPGKDAFDFAGLFDVLTRSGYEGPAFIEVYSDMFGDISELYDSYAYLAPIAARARR